MVTDAPSMSDSEFDQYGVNSLECLNLVSYNLHGFNQGCNMVRDLSFRCDVSIFLLQEHWLTPDNLCKFDSYFPQFMCVGSSAMQDVVSSGVLRGRPFGGVMTLVCNKLQKFTKILSTMERLVVIIVGHVLVINVYFPCVGTIDRLNICENLLWNISYWISKYPSCLFIGRRL